MGHKATGATARETMSQASQSAKGMSHPRNMVSKWKVKFLKILSRIGFIPLAYELLGLFLIGTFSLDADRAKAALGK